MRISDWSSDVCSSDLGPQSRSRPRERTPMQSQSKILEDMAKVASSALGVAAGMRSEVEARFREQLERLLTQMDLVPREEFDAMQAVAVAAREEIGRASCRERVCQYV